MASRKRNASIESRINLEIIVKRSNRRRIDALERTNHSGSSSAILSTASTSRPNNDAVDDNDNDSDNDTFVDEEVPAIGRRARQSVLADKRSGRKKSTMNIRSALLYRKNFATLLEESGIDKLPPTIPTYLTAASPPPLTPHRSLCSACGYWGKYECMQCSMSYCSANCGAAHSDVCNRPLL
ncbi:hypothetical protein BDV98DRAFT_552558 [Pterulicium gracile]|uniref:HIT-type domain-containing protein n=1 Tax=Pterulicium gracile TaxID=1884261 RepID=A0A5C3Q9E4_9AGAR|nr:hypothetical protein BDV98DRAFT_552558 [Pterula gracilis]